MHYWARTYDRDKYEFNASVIEQLGKAELTTMIALERHSESLPTSTSTPLLLSTLFRSRSPSPSSPPLPCSLALASGR